MRVNSHPRSGRGIPQPSFAKHVLYEAPAPEIRAVPTCSWGHFVDLFTYSHFAGNVCSPTQSPWSRHFSRLRIRFHLSGNISRIFPSPFQFCALQLHRTTHRIYALFRAPERGFYSILCTPPLMDKFFRLPLLKQEFLFTNESAAPN